MGRMGVTAPGAAALEAALPLAQVGGPATRWPLKRASKVFGCEAEFDVADVEVCCSPPAEGVCVSAVLCCALPKVDLALLEATIPPPGLNSLVGESNSLALEPRNISLRSFATWRASP